jgi:CheY-like chemotaxis protein
VQAESAGSGQGASFLVRLPIKQSKGDCGLSVSGAGEFGVIQSKARARVNKSFVSSNLSGVRVLVVDLDADSLDFACTVLEDCGAHVETASSGMEALEAVERLNPDVLAIDIEIPAPDGEALLPQVRSLVADREIPALAFTAVGRVEERVRALQEGFQIYVPKPIEPAELVAVVASLAARSNDLRFEILD